MLSIWDSAWSGEAERCELYLDKEMNNFGFSIFFAQCLNFWSNKLDNSLPA